MFDSIVIAFDGSVNAGKALDLAARLAARDQAVLGIVHVIDSDYANLPMEIRKMNDIEHIIKPVPGLLMDFEKLPSNLVGDLASSSVDSQRAMLQYAEFLVDEARKQAIDRGVSQVQTNIATGDPAEEVTRFATANKADLVVCGSRGLGRMKKLLLGSTSHKIAQLTECSCLTVK